VWPVVVTLAFVAVLFAAVFPTRTYLAQRSSTNRAVEQLRVLGHQNDVLAERATQLHSDAEIEHLARERYNLVRPGEQAYAVLPPPAAPRPADTKKPEPNRNPAQRVWHALTDWL
jgi:cell division protein FtsB